MRRVSFMSATTFGIPSMARLHRLQLPSVEVPRRKQVRMKMHVPYPSHRLPLEALSNRATRLALTPNMNAVSAIGLKLPRALMPRADQVVT